MEKLFNEQEARSSKRNLQSPQAAEGLLVVSRSSFNYIFHFFFAYRNAAHWLCNQLLLLNWALDWNLCSTLGQPSVYFGEKLCAAIVRSHASCLLLKWITKMWYDSALLAHRKKVKRAASRLAELSTFSRRELRVNVSRQNENPRVRGKLWESP